MQVVSPARHLLPLILGAALVFSANVQASSSVGHHQAGSAHSQTVKAQTKHKAEGKKAGKHGAKHGKKHGKKHSKAANRGL